MGLQTRVINVINQLVIIEYVRYQAGALFVLSDSRMQGTNASQGQKAVERCTSNTDTVGPIGNLLRQLSTCGHDAPTDDITVTIDIFRGRVNNKIGTELNRILQRG